MAQVPSLDPARVEDVIVGCAMPEYEQGMNVARIGVLLAGPARQRGRHDDQPLLLVGAQRGVDRRRPHPHRRGGHHDRRGHREHEHDPDARAARAQPRRCSRATRTSASRTAWGSPPRRSPSAVEGVARGAGRVRARVAPEGARRAGGAASSTPRSRRSRCPSGRAGSRGGNASVTRRKVVARDEGPRADTSAEGLAKLRPVFAAKGSVTAGNSSQMSDGAGAVDPRVRSACCASSASRRSRASSAIAVAGVPPEIMGVGPDRGDPEGARRRPASSSTTSTGSS